MDHYIEHWKTIVAQRLTGLAEKKGLINQRFSAQDIIAERPPKPELGDIGFPLFSYARLFHMPPERIAEETMPLGAIENFNWPGSLRAMGPYLNVFLDRKANTAYLLGHIDDEGWARSALLQGQKIMIEFSCPNTNKPLHLGHLRNNVLGESLARIMKAAGAEVRKVNLINDRASIFVNRCLLISLMERVEPQKMKA